MLQLSSYAPEPELEKGIDYNASKFTASNELVTKLHMYMYLDLVIMLELHSIILFLKVLCVVEKLIFMCHCCSCLISLSLSLALASDHTKSKCQ